MTCDTDDSTHFNSLNLGVTKSNLNLCGVHPTAGKKQGPKSNSSEFFIKEQNIYFKTRSD